MTYREAFLKDLEDRVIDEDANVWHFPLCFRYFILSMSNILIRAAKTLYESECPTLRIGNETIEDGRPIENPTAEDLAFVIGGPSIGRGSTLTFALNDFISWLLRQEVKEEGTGMFEGTEMFSVKQLTEKWNEYQLIRNEQR